MYMYRILEAEFDDVCTCIALSYSVIYIIIYIKIGRSRCHQKLLETVVSVFMQWPLSSWYIFM
jgi:hypothetical protein